MQRDGVVKMLRELDPDGTETRRVGQLRRRQYVSVGPNFCLHADGYDKLKPYGFPILKSKFYGLKFTEPAVTQ